MPIKTLVLQILTVNKGTSNEELSNLIAAAVIQRLKDEFPGVFE